MQEWTGAPGAVLLDDGRTFAYRQYGDPRGVPCILIHDTPGTAHSAGWLLHGARPSTRTRIIAVDRLGWGASSDLRPQETAEQLRLAEAKAIHRLIRVLALRSVPLIAVGSGAPVALAAAALHPDAVSTVTCLSPRVPAAAHPGPLAEWRRRRQASRRRWSLPFLPGVNALGEDVDDWTHVLRRLPPSARSLIGPRWFDPEFRRAYRLDAEATVASPAFGQPLEDEPADLDITVPTTVVTDAEDLDAVAFTARLGAHPGVRVISTRGPAAGMQTWPTVLDRVHGGFAPAV